MQTTYVCILLYIIYIYIFFITQVILMFLSPLFFHFKCCTQECFSLIILGPIRQREHNGWKFKKDELRLLRWDKEVLPNNYNYPKVEKGFFFSLTEDFKQTTYE